MDFKVDRTAVRIIPLKEEVNGDESFLKLTYVERLEALESLRQFIFGYTDETPPRLQRVYTITQQTRS